MLKRTATHIILLLTLGIKCAGQISTTDSVMNTISWMPDTVKLNILNEKARAEQYRSLKTGLVYADKRMEIARRINDPREIAKTWHIYGNLYTTSGLYDNAEENYIKALHIFDSLNMDENMASILHNLGLLFHRKNDTISSIKYYKKSINLRKKSLDSRRTGDELTSLGETLLSFKQYDESRRLLLEALECFKGIKGYERKADAYAFLFDNWHATGQDNEKKWIDSMIVENELLGEPALKGMIDLRLCKYHLVNNNLDLCEAYLDSINFDILHKYEVINPLDVIYTLSEKYRTQGEHGKALNYRMLYNDYKNKLTDMEVQNLVQNYNIRLSITASEEEISLKHHQNELLLKKIRIEKIVSTVLNLALAITLIILTYMVYSLRAIRKTKRKLALRRTGLQEAYIRSSGYKEKILSIRENKNDFFSIVSLKLSKPFTNLTTILSTISTYLEDNNKDLKLKSMIEKLYRDASGIEKGLKSILLWSKLQRNKYAVEYASINFNDFMYEMLPSLLGLALKKDIRIRFDIDPDINIKYDRFSLETLITILVENSVEHSSPKSDIIIRTQNTKQAYILSITDFGTGIMPELQNRIFNLSRVKDKTPQQDSQKIGLGLLIARLLTSINNSTINLESEEKRGTTVYIYINKTNG